MNQQETIKIPISKGKMILLLLGCLGFVAVGVCFVLHPEQFRSPVARSTANIFIGGCLGIAFFGYVGIFICRRLVDPSPGLVISGEGVTDNSSGTPAGFIPWSDVMAISEYAVRGQRFLILKVKVGGEYIGRQKGPLKRWIMKKNFTLYRKGIGISTNSLKISYPDLKKLIEKRFDDYKREMP